MTAVRIGWDISFLDTKTLHNTVVEGPLCVFSPDLVRHPELADGLHEGLEVIVEPRHQHGDGDVRLGQSETEEVRDKLSEYSLVSSVVLH